MQKDQLHKDYGSILLKKFSEKKYHEVITKTEELMQSLGDSVFGYSIIGNSYFNLKNYKNSVLAFEKEIELSSDENFLAYFNLARNYKILGQNQHAEKNFLISHKINPDYFLTNSLLSSLLIEMNKLQEAEKYLYHAYQINENDPTTIINLTSLLFKIRKFSEGVKIASKAILKITDHFQLYYNYALLLNEENDFETSYKMNEKALKLMPREGIEYLDALSLKATNLTALNKPKDSIVIDLEILKVKPDHFGALKNLSKSFSNIGQHRESLLYNRLADGNLRFEINENDKKIFLNQYKKIELI